MRGDPAFRAQTLSPSPRRPHAPLEKEGRSLAGSVRVGGLPRCAEPSITFLGFVIFARSDAAPHPSLDASLQEAGPGHHVRSQARARDGGSRRRAVTGHRVPGVCCSHSGVTEIPPPPAPRLRPVWVTGVSPAFRLLLLHVQAPPASTAPQGPSRVPSKRLLGRHVCAMCRPSRALLGHPGRASGVGCSASEGKDGDRGPWQRPGNSLPRGTGLGSPFASAFAGSSFWNGCCVGLLM